VTEATCIKQEKQRNCKMWGLILSSAVVYIFKCFYRMLDWRYTFGSKHVAIQITYNKVLLTVFYLLTNYRRTQRYVQKESSVLCTCISELCRIYNDVLDECMFRFRYTCNINLLAPELFFFNFSTSVYKIWIIQEPNTLELWNKLHFVEKNRRIYTMFKIFSTYMCWINI